MYSKPLSTKKNMGKQVYFDVNHHFIGRRACFWGKWLHKKSRINEKIKSAD